MIANAGLQYSESVIQFERFDHTPLQLSELFELLKLAISHGYSIKAARDTKSRHDGVLSDVYAVWYAIENEVDIFPDNVDQLIELTEWKR